MFIIYLFRFGTENALGKDHDFDDEKQFTYLTNIQAQREKLVDLSFDKDAEKISE